MTEGTTASHLFVIFGGMGDLSGRKLLPALHHLARQARLGERWRILALGRSSDQDDESFRAWAKGELGGAGHESGDLGAWCETCLHYQALPNGSPEDYRALRARVEEIEREADLPGNRTFYLAVPAAAFGPTIIGLGEAGLARGPGFTRLVIEKPFGHDLESARELNETVHAHFNEDQVYRIDHYLGKETVQNLLVFRFGNTIFENLWNRDRVKSVQITVAESLGVEDRAGFYERTGALRDILQNHLAQILALAAMEVPVAFDADAVRYEKMKVLRAVRPIRAEDVVFARYARGPDGAPGYLEENGVAPDSVTETYVAAKLDIDTWRWQGVPFYVRTGKRLGQKRTEIVVRFRSPPVCLFESMGTCALHENVLVITLQPDEGFALYMDVKAPGEPLELRRIPLDFRYSEEFGELPDAYENLLLDVLEGDQTLFVHGDEVAASWKLFQPLLDERPPIQEYPAGSWGPAAADRLLAREGNRWRNPGAGA